MDNIKFDILAEGKTAFDCAMKIAFGSHRDACGYVIDNGEGGAPLNVKPKSRDESLDIRLVAIWSHLDKNPLYQRLLNPQSVEEFTETAWKWLNGICVPLSGDGDVEYGKAFRVYCEGFGHVAPYGYQGFVAIEPAIAMYGK